MMTVVTDIVLKDSYLQCMDSLRNGATKFLDINPRAGTAVVESLSPQPVKTLMSLLNTGADIAEISTGQGPAAAESVGQVAEMSKKLKLFAIKNGSFARAEGPSMSFSGGPRPASVERASDAQIKSRSLQPRGFTKEEGQVFSDALGILSRLGGKWREIAIDLSKLDGPNGKINIDNAKCSSQNFAEWLMNVPNDAIAMTSDDRISLHKSLFQEVFPDGTSARKSERLKNAFRLASVLAHEHQHWKSGHAHGNTTTEKGMYSIERMLALAAIAYEYDHGADRSRIDAISEVAGERESNGFQIEALSGKPWFQ